LYGEQRFDLTKYFNDFEKLVSKKNIDSVVRYLGANATSDGAWLFPTKTTRANFTVGFQRYFAGKYDIEVDGARKFSTNTVRHWWSTYRAGLTEDGTGKAQALVLAKFMAHSIGNAVGYYRKDDE
jgi:hypothetical protein